MADYDEYYKTENLFGEPYAALIDFFKNYEPKGNLIDLGCGQGRDSIALAKLGYTVTGVDNSKLGIEQMLQKTNCDNLKIYGLVGDIFKYDNFQNFDIVLLDSMFHFEKRDKERETQLIRKIALDIRSNGLICVCIQDTGSKVRILKETLRNIKLEFELINESSFIYNYEDTESGHKSSTKYCMYIVRKK